jgi:hypothetical protein
MPSLIRSFPQTRPVIPAIAAAGEPYGVST